MSIAQCRDTNLASEVICGYQQTEANDDRANRAPVHRSRMRLELQIGPQVSATTPPAGLEDR